MYEANAVGLRGGFTGGCSGRLESTLISGASEKDVICSSGLLVVCFVDVEPPRIKLGTNLLNIFAM
jgi:hypothetical protein